MRRRHPAVRVAACPAAVAPEEHVQEDEEHRDLAHVPRVRRHVLQVPRPFVAVVPQLDPARRGPAPRDTPFASRTSLSLTLLLLLLLRLRRRLMTCRTILCAARAGPRRLCGRLGGGSDDAEVAGWGGDGTDPQVREAGPGGRLHHHRTRRGFLEGAAGPAHRLAEEEELATRAQVAGPRHGCAADVRQPGLAAAHSLRGRRGCQADEGQQGRCAWGCRQGREGPLAAQAAIDGV